MMNPTAPPNDRDLCNCAALRRATRRLSQFYDSVLAPLGLKSTQYAILNQIQRRTGEAATIRDLADLLVMDQSTLGQNLRPLERDGLVALAPDVADRRRRLITLTAEGRARFEAARPLWAQAQERFESAFGASQAAALRAELRRISRDPSLTVDQESSSL